MMASGNKSFEKCKEVFEKIANKVFFIGEKGTPLYQTSHESANYHVSLTIRRNHTSQKADVDPKFFLKF